MDRHRIIDQFFGNADTPIEWASEQEKQLHFWLDDLHCPQPISPMWFDIGGWWLTCDHMFRRFATPFAADWIAKKINGYVFTAAIPADARLLADSTEYDSRYGARVPRDPSYPAKMGPYLNAVLPVYATNFLTWWRERFRPEIERNFAYLDGYDYAKRSLPEIAIWLDVTSRPYASGLVSAAAAPVSRPARNSATPARASAVFRTARSATATAWPWPTSIRWTSSSRAKAATARRRTRPSIRSSSRRGSSSIYRRS